MCTYAPQLQTDDSESPDHLDAMVWGVTKLTGITDQKPVYHLEDTYAV